MFYIEQACTTRFSVVFRDASGNILDGGEMDGTEFICQVRKAVNHPSVLFTPTIDDSSLSDGYIYVYITPENTDLMVVGNQYYFDILMRNDSGDVFKVFKTDTLVLRPTVSRFS